MGKSKKEAKKGTKKDDKKGYTEINSVEEEIPEDIDPDPALPEDNIPTILQSYAVCNETFLDDQVAELLGTSFDEFICEYLKGLATRSKRNTVLILRKYLSEVAMAGSKVPFNNMHNVFLKATNNESK